MECRSWPRSSESSTASFSAIQPFSSSTSWLNWWISLAACRFWRTQDRPSFSQPLIQINSSKGSLIYQIYTCSLVLMLLLSSSHSLLSASSLLRAWSSCCSPRPSCCTEVSRLRPKPETSETRTSSFFWRTYRWREGTKSYEMNKEGDISSLRPKSFRRYTPW